MAVFVPLSTIFLLYLGVSFIGKGNKQSTIKKKQQIYHKLLTNFDTLICKKRINAPSHEQ